MNQEPDIIRRRISDTTHATGPARHRSRVPWCAALASLLVCASVLAWPTPSPAQETYTTEELPARTLEELEELVGPIALYPDDLLAIVLPASTYPLQIVEAARLLEAREGGAVVEPEEDWDDSVIALLNYPDALRLLNDDLDWTWSLGEAVLAQQEDVLEAVERFRDQAYLAGNLKTDDHQKVTRSEGVIEIEPVESDVIYVPYYDPADVVVYQPRRVYYYYPTAYPVYYYPYRSIARFHGLGFYGVSSIFSISWHSRYLHLSFYDHFAHPFYGYYYAPDYFYRHYRVRDYHRYYGNRVRHDGRGRYRWHAPRHRGARPVRRHYDRERFIARSVDRGRAERGVRRDSARDQRRGVRRAAPADGARSRTNADRQRQGAFSANSNRRATADRSRNRTAADRERRGEFAGNTGRRSTVDRATRREADRPRRTDRLAVADARRQTDFARNRSATERPSSANRRYTTHRGARPDADGQRVQRRPAEAARLERRREPARRDVARDPRPRSSAPARSQRAERANPPAPPRATKPDRQSSPRAAPQRQRESAPRRQRSESRATRSSQPRGDRSTGRRSGRER